MTVVPLPVCFTRVTPNGYRWFCWRCGKASPRMFRKDKIVTALDKHVLDKHGPVGDDPWVPPWER